MKSIFIFFAVILAACTNSEQTLRLECEQNVGEACNKMGQKLESDSPQEATSFYERACKLENTNGCVRLADKIGPNEKSIEMLRYSCKRGNSTACAKELEFLSKVAK